MASIHCDIVSSVSAGATADTFDNVGTVRTPEDAISLLGFWVNAVNLVTTAAEAINGQWRFTNNSLALSTIRTGPPAHGGHPATNIGHNTQRPMFIPTYRKGPIGQQDIVVDFSTHLPDPTEACSALAGAVFTTTRGEGAIPADILNGYRFSPPVVTSRIADWDAEAAADAATVAETAITDLVVDSRADGIAALGCATAPDVFAAEDMNGFVRFRSSISGFEPQEWPLTGSNAPIGTAVGVGFSDELAGMTYPMWFPKKPGSLATITPSAVWLVAVTSGNNTVTADVGWTIPSERSF